MAARSPRVHRLRAAAAAALLGVAAPAGAVVNMQLVDFEDRTMGPFSQVGDGYRRPMPAPYHMWYGLTPVGGEPDGDGLLWHTGSDSGVRVRHGDTRMGEMRTGRFVLGVGDISWESTGSGGWVAICPASEGWSPTCVSRRQRRRSTLMAADKFDAANLTGLVGQQVYITVIDDRDDGWGFIAFDNLRYPVDVEETRRLQAAADNDNTEARAWSDGGDAAENAVPAAQAAASLTAASAAGSAGSTGGPDALRAAKVAAPSAASSAAEGGDTARELGNIMSPDSGVAADEDESYM